MSDPRYAKALAELDEIVARNPHLITSAPDALTTCNACDVNPMEPGDEAGYCAECHDEASARQDERNAQ